MTIYLQLPYPHCVPVQALPSLQQILPDKCHPHLQVCSNVRQFPETFCALHFPFPADTHDALQLLPFLQASLCHLLNYCHTRK